MRVVDFLAAACTRYRSWLLAGMLLAAGLLAAMAYIAHVTDPGPAHPLYLRMQPAAAPPDSHP